MKFALLFIIKFSILVSINCLAAIPIIPGLQGFGVETVAGRGGEIIRVTNLNSSGEGSLGWALFQSGPRTIIFDVSGTIWIQDHLQIENPYVTVAFQTAPSPGITLAGAGIEIRTHDVLLHHPRIRVGDLINDAYPGDRDGIAVKAGSYNVVIDHCSVSWGVDENVSVSGSAETTEQDNIHDVTFSNCIIAEGLANSIHPKGEHSKGMLILDYSENIAVIKNVFAHNVARSPSLKGATSSFVANNLIYNAGASATAINEGLDSGPVIASIIGNRYLLGPDSSFGIDSPFADDDDEYLSAIEVFEHTSPDSKIYLEDNSSSHSNQQIYIDWLQHSSPLTPLQGEWSIVRLNTGFIPQTNTVPIDINDYVPLAVSDLTDILYTTAGSRPLDRDSVDSRIIDEIKNGTGTIINSQDEVSGWPTLNENSEPNVLPNAPNNDDDNDGYTNLEEWLHYKALVVEQEDVQPWMSSQVDTTPTEKDSNHINYFLLQIGTELVNDASVDYFTQDGTATSGQDYVFSSGTATIKAGSTHTVIGIEIIGDNAKENTETFMLTIKNPIGASFPDGVTEISVIRTIIDDD